MRLLKRLKRLWALSDERLATEEHVALLFDTLTEAQATTKKLTEWMAVLLRAELARHEAEEIQRPTRSLR